MNEITRTRLLYTLLLGVLGPSMAVLVVVCGPKTEIDRSLLPSDSQFYGVTVPMVVSAADLGPFESHVTEEMTTKYRNKLVSMEGILVLETGGARLALDRGGPYYQDLPIEGVSLPPKMFLPMDGKQVRIEGFLHFSRGQSLPPIIRDVRWIEEIPPLVTP